MFQVVFLACAAFLLLLHRLFIQTYLPLRVIIRIVGVVCMQVTLADKYEYVMHGRVYQCEHMKDSKVKVFASFGGLLMRLIGDQRHVANIEVDSRVFCLLRKNA